MCFGSDPPPPQLPASPPPPPPTLEQAAPETNTPTDSEAQYEASQGVKKYRSSSLGINAYNQTAKNGSAPNTNTGLGISM